MNERKSITAATATVNDGDIMVDGLSLDEHRAFGGAILDLICALQMLEDAATDGDRKAKYQRMAYIVDGVLMDLSDIFIDDYHGITGKHPDEDGNYPYPRFHYEHRDNDIDVNIPKQPENTVCKYAITADVVFGSSTSGNAEDVAVQAVDDERTRASKLQFNDFTTNYGLPD